jgi:phosphate transport system permease protein
VIEHGAGRLAASPRLSKEHRVSQLTPTIPPLALETDGAPASRARHLLRRDRRFGGDAILAVLAKGSAGVVLVMIVALVAILAYAALPSITTFGAKFLVSSDWRPNELEVPKLDALGHVVLQDGETVTTTIPPSFGALPVIYGTGVSSVLALLLAVPIGFGAALFLVRIGHRRLVGPVSFLVEFLAAVPSIAFGIWGLLVLAPILQNYIEPAIRSVLGPIPGLGWLFNEMTADGAVRELPLVGRDMFCGGIVLGIMILPIITSISRDVLKTVPSSQIEGSLALGATWWQSAREMLRYGRSGLLGAVMLGLARAAGETMAVTMVIGNNSQIRASIFAPAQTMSSLLANEFAEASTDLHRSALSEVALVLLLMSLLFNMSARWLVVGSAGRSAAAH